VGDASCITTHSTVRASEDARVRRPRSPPVCRGAGGALPCGGTPLPRRPGRLCTRAARHARRRWSGSGALASRFRIDVAPRTGRPPVTSRVLTESGVERQLALRDGHEIARAPRGSWSRSCSRAAAAGRASSRDRRVEHFPPRQIEPAMPSKASSRRRSTRTESRNCAVPRGPTERRPARSRTRFSACSLDIPPLAGRPRSPPRRT
jgi:hypothetical protein